MVRYHPEHMARRIIPLLFLPAEELRQMGINAAHSFLRSLKQ
jgi:hypothetical protein